MTKKTATRADLLEAVYASCTRLTRSEAKDILEMTIEEMCMALVQGEVVKLRGFGTFGVRAKTARVGRNPRTGKTYPIDARRVMTFRPSPQLTGELNQQALISEGVARRVPAALTARRDVSPSPLERPLAGRLGEPSLDGCEGIHEIPTEAS